MEHPLLSPASSYDELWRQVDFATMDIPERFNLGVACVDQQDPDARALTVVEVDRTSRDHTFGEVTESSNRLANALAGLGIGQGDVVGLVSPASLETGVGFMAMFRMGAVALPLSSLFGPDALRFRLRNAGAKAVVTAAANADRVREALDDGGEQVPLLVIGGAGAESYDDALAAASPEFTPVDTAAEDPAFLIYTSGTTGDPKGALHAHRIVFGHMPAFEAIFEFYPQAARRALVAGRLGVDRRDHGHPRPGLVLRSAGRGRPRAGVHRRAGGLADARVRRDADAAAAHRAAGDPRVRDRRRRVRVPRGRPPAARCWAPTC